MSSVQEKYEEFVNKEDTLIRSVRICEQAMSLLKDELVYKHRGETCQGTVRDICEWIQQREEKLRREIFSVRWEMTVLACQFPNAKKQAEESPL
ncbi:hypothetical protein EDM59_01860 [Brevibacillus nitrificans]|uniref:Uncharacterized protein n=1 Tax=Brevibacillus nitrificans TaxID=651560 RepID=A0A3M8DRY0_9BACL|nr:hypothetical protein [Brevibacillus nitrificans]RNB90215.1 hypothetical protein EDM59_01860 [Brevibacillus nitrificans]